MIGLQKQQTLVDLRARIAGFETQPVLAEKVDLARHEQPTEGNVLAAPAGILHEVFTDEQRNSGAALGFALGHAQGLLSAERPAMLYLQLAHEGQEFGLPYGAGLFSAGIDPQAVIFGRMQTMAELLWALEEAVACRAVAAVLADIGGHPKMLDFTVSRRLTLRAASAGASVFILRYGQEREASAAKLRWHVMPAASGALAFDHRAPGEARWRVRLEKGHLAEGRDGLDQGWLLGWTQNGFFRIKDRLVPAGRTVPRKAAYGAPLATLGDRLPQTA